MKPPKCRVHPPSAQWPKKALRALRYDGDALFLEIELENASFAEVVFRAVVGFRLLDERDLCEFWSAYSEPCGWLYEVDEGGWLELESHRKLFNAPEFIIDLREYFFVDDKCVSVLSSAPPEIRLATI